MNYTKVPNIITGKDLDYLSDMFNWNYNAYKNTYNSIQNVEDEELKSIMLECNNIFKDSINQILDIMLGGLNENIK